MEKEFKEKLKENGQSLKWFYENKVKPVSEISYGGFTLQLNGYAPIRIEILKEMEIYVGQ